MIRLLILAAVLVFWGDVAHAQIGNIFADPGASRSNGRPVDRYAKAAWDQLPSPFLSCIDATLQRDRSSINDLIRQSIYPNNPQLRDITARCEQDLKPKVEQPNLVMREWSSMSPSWRNCVDSELHREQGTTVEALITQGIRPSDYRLQTMREFCNAPAGAASASRPASGGPDARSQAFAHWLTTSVLTRPIFAKSFKQCREIVSLYQDKVLSRMQATEANATSKSDQQRIGVAVADLNGRRAGSAKAACLKQFFSALGIAGSATNYYADELGVLNGRLSENRIELQTASATKFDDLTQQGLAQLAQRMGLEHLQARELQAEIDSAGRQVPAVGYLACLLSREWVGLAPDSYSTCHGIFLEKKVLEIAPLLSP